MKTQPFWWRLLKHGSIFVLRVFGIFGAAAAGAVAVAGSAASATSKQEEYDENDCATAAKLGHFPNGESCYSDTRCLQYMDD